MNTADEQQVKESQKQEEKRQKRREKALLHVMGTPQGREFIWGLLEDARIFRSSFTGNSATFFNEGRRDFGLQLLNDVQHYCPKLYLDMQREALDKQFAKSE